MLNQNIVLATRLSPSVRPSHQCITYWANQIWHEKLNEHNVDEDKEKPDQGDHVWSQPAW